MARTVSGSISLPYPGFFSPFPHGTGCAIGDRSCLALSSGLDGFIRGSTCSVLLGYHLSRFGFCPYGALTHYGATFQPLPLNPQRSLFLPTPNPASGPFGLGLDSGLLMGSGGPTTPFSELNGLGSSAFARRYLRNLFDFSSSGYLDVSVHRVPSSIPMCSGKGL